jgi:hypothetical protein
VPPIVTTSARRNARVSVSTVPAMMFEIAERDDSDMSSPRNSEIA